MVQGANCETVMKTAEKQTKNANPCCNAPDLAGPARAAAKGSTTWESQGKRDGEDRNRKAASTQPRIPAVYWCWPPIP